MDAKNIIIDGSNKEGVDFDLEGAFKSTSIFPSFLKGRVTETPGGNAVPDATITLRRSVKTIGSMRSFDDGSYFFQVPPGSYGITVSKSGFRQYIDNLALSAFETSTLNVALSAGTDDDDVDGGGDAAPAGNDEVARLAVSPETARRSFMLRDAVVSALDDDGSPLFGITIDAASSGFNVLVFPASATTDESGEARFKFKFGLISNKGDIVFSANGLTATISRR